MDYTKSSIVTIMTKLAADTGCQYQPFSQAILLNGVTDKIGGPLIEGSGGICHGLAVAWLETMQKKGGDFVAQVGDLEGSPMFYRSYMSYRHQETFGLISTSGTWRDDDLQQRDYRAKDRFFGAPAITQNSGLIEAGKSRSFGLSQAGMEALCAWLCAAFDQRYFMISVPNHAMAATGSRLGICSFFDPNCGIVSANSTRALATCLYRYFSTGKIKVAYKDHGDTEWLTATKYRA